MAVFNAPEFGGLPYAVPPGASYRDILSEALSEQRRAARLGEGTRFAYLSLSVANASRRLGLFDAVEAPFTLALSIFRAGGDASGASWAFWSRGNLDQQLGNHRAAAEAFARSYRLAWEACNPIAARYALAGLAEILRIMGYYAEARTQHVVLLRQFREADDPRGVIWAMEGLAQMDLRQGKFSFARSAFYSALSNANDIGDGRGAAWARRGIAEVALRSGELLGSLQLAASACEEFDRVGINIGSGYGELTRARAYRKLGDRGMSELCLNRATTRFEAGRHDRGAQYVAVERSLLVRLTKVCLLADAR